MDDADRPGQTGDPSNSAVPLTRTQEAYQHLARLVKTLGPNAQLPTFAELRETLGISVSTLNRALELLEAHRILVRRHGVGIFVSSTLGRKSIALVCSPRFFEGPEISPFWAILLDQVRRHVAGCGHELTMHFSGQDSTPQPFFMDFMRAVTEKRVQGVIGIGLSAEAALWLENQGVPVLGFAAGSPYRVDVDYKSLIARGVHHLARAGCRRIALWSNHYWRDLPEGYIHNRTLLAPLAAVQPYREALTELAMPFDPALVQDSRYLYASQSEEPPRTFWEQGYQTARSIFGENADPSRQPDGIVSPSELFSQGILMGLQQSGVAIGHDVQLVSHANEESPVLKPWAGQIVIGEVSPAELARMLLTLLEARMSGETVAATTYHVPALRTGKTK